MPNPNKKNEDRPRERSMDDPGPSHRPRASTHTSQERSNYGQMGNSGPRGRERPSTEDAQERLRQIQMDDLGSARRERVSTEDDPRNISHASLEELEAHRQSNIPGTEAFKRASERKDALKAWAKMKDDSLHTAFEKLQDLNGGQSHRANLNARFDSIRDHPPKTHAYPRANFQSAHPRRFSNVGAPRARPMANVQPAHSRRSPNVRSPRAQPMANVVESHVRPIPPDPTRGGRGQITKHHPRASPSSGRGGGIIGTRGRMSGFDTRAHVSAFETRGHRASRSREYRTPVKAQPDFSRNITTPEAFLADLRRRSNPPASPTSLNPPQRPQPVSRQETAVPATASSNPAAVSKTLKLDLRPKPVSRQEPAVPASASSNPAAASTSEVARRSVSPRAPRPMIKTVAQKPLGDTLSGIGRPSSSPQHAGAASHQPRMAISQPTSADPVPANLLLDFNEPEPPRDQQREAISSYSHLQGLDFGGPPTLNWSLDLPPARQEGTSADRSAAMKAQVHEHNGSHDLFSGNLPPLTSAPSYDLFDDPRPYVRSTPAIGQNPFTDPLPLASTENIPFRADRSSEISQTIDYDSFRDYRSPLDPPSSGESKPSKSGAIRTPSLLSPKKTERLYFTPGLEKLRVSESPTRKPAPNRKPVSELARSIHAEAWLMHHKIGEAKVIGVKASLDPDHLPAHTSEYEYPIPQPPRPKVIGPGPGPSVTRFQRQGTEIQQRVAGKVHSGGTSSQRAPVRVLGPAPGPLSVRPQRQESLNQAPRNPQDQMVKEPASSNQNPGSSGTQSSQSSAMGFHGISGSKPRVLGIQPFDPSKKKGKM